MALAKKKYSEVPPDAVVLSEREAIIYQFKILKKWKNTSDTFAFNYGPYFLGGASFLTGLFINNHFRQKLKLLHYGRMSSYLPICVVPAAMSAVTHLNFVMKDVVIQKGTCPVCTEMRASALQSFFGCVFPAILGPISALPLAHKYATYDVPYISQEPKKVFQLVRKLTKPIANILFAIFIGQALLASTVTYLEGRSVITVNMKLALLEEELENKY